MKNRIFPNFYPVRFGGIAIIASFSLFFFLLPVSSMAIGPEHWISLAEKACIYDRSYNVDRVTEIYQKQKNENGIQTSEELIEQSSTQLTYTKQEGLKPKSTQRMGEKTSLSSSPSAFTLDVGHMLKKMRGKAQWILEDENETIDNEDCVVLSSSGEKWLVRLWIRKKDGVVLRYDQYLNNQFIGTSKIEYYPPIDGKYLTKKATTLFHLTGQLFIQHYDNYSFPE